MKTAKTIASFIWRAYCIIGAVWLTFTICSFLFFHKQNESTVTGEILRIERAEWDGYKEVLSEVKTDDGKGSVFVKMYDAGYEVGDTVSVEISTGGSRTGYIHAYITRTSEAGTE